MDKLAIDAYQAQIMALKGNFMLQASPGSGKSTRVPVMLHRAHQHKVIVLEPRRMAAKFAALRVAAEQGWELGREVGYVFRWEKKASETTLITYFTEGSFIRYLLAHPDLPGVGTVILDEFHERHLETDLAWAMLSNLKRPVQLGLMSATLDLVAGDQAKFGQSTAVIKIDAPTYPLALHYLDDEDRGKSLVARAINALLEAWEEEGDILVFLPGLAEILQVAQALAKDEDFAAATLILHGERSLAEQQAVLAPRQERKIILATNIAESSLTIPGIKIVIDSGLERTLVYQPLVQTSHLVTQKISRASAIQRAARSNRQGQGHCWRLYTEDEFNALLPHALPEIQCADLTSAYLLAAAWPNPLMWQNDPPALAVKTAQQTLRRLNALDEHDHLTPLGKQLSGWPLHPRQALMMAYACLASDAVAQEVINFIARDMRSDRLAHLDTRVEQRLRHKWQTEKEKIKAQQDFLFSPSATNFLSDAAHWTLEQIVFWAYWDHLALWRPPTHNFIHAQGVTLAPAKSLLDDLAHQHLWWCVLDLDGQGRVAAAVPVEKDWAYLMPVSPVTEKEELVFDETKNKVVNHSEVWLDHLVLARESLPPRREQQAEVFKLLFKHAQKMINDLQSSPRGQRWQYIAQTLMATTISSSSSSSSANFTLADLLSHAGWKKLLGDASCLPEGLADYFFLQLAEELQNTYQIDTEQSFPSEVSLTNGKCLAITYRPGESPFVAAMMQDFYGVRELPDIFAQQVRLTAKLLGPHQRPIQVTSDLASFWQNTYPEFKKEWSRNYPHHYWPDDPVHALPVRLKRYLPADATLHNPARPNAKGNKKRKN